MTTDRGPDGGDSAAIAGLAQRCRTAGGTRAAIADNIRRIGVLPTGYRQPDPEGQARVAAFRDALGKLGWDDGRNVAIELRWSSNELERIREETTALVDSAPDAIEISSKPCACRRCNG